LPYFAAIKLPLPGSTKGGTRVRENASWLEFAAVRNDPGGSTGAFGLELEGGLKGRE